MHESSSLSIFLGHLNFLAPPLRMKFSQRRMAMKRNYKAVPINSHLFPQVLVLLFIYFILFWVFGGYGSFDGCGKSSRILSRYCCPVQKVFIKKES